MRRVSAIAIAWMMVSVASLSGQGTSASSPLLDGRCDEYPRLADERHDAGPGVALFVMQNADYVWLCYSLPPESHGVLDMYLDAPGLPEPINLHLSAQLGEWPVSGEGPGRANSDRWWQVEGWWANASHFNGSDGEGAERRIRFLPSEGRELQLAKSRFGSGEWRFQMNIQGVEMPDGSNGRFYFPEDTGEGRELFTLTVR